MLSPADLEVNVLDFRHRSFQFERLVEVAGGPVAVFSRTETESERQLRPKLVRLTAVVPLGWVVYDESADSLLVRRAGTPGPGQRSASPEASAVEVAAEPPEFEEDGLRWRRVPAGPAGYVYAPAELAGELLSPAGLTALGLS